MRCVPAPRWRGSACAAMHMRASRVANTCTRVITWMRTPTAQGLIGKSTEQQDRRRSLALSRVSASRAAGSGRFLVMSVVLVCVDSRRRGVRRRERRGAACFLLVILNDFSAQRERDAFFVNVKAFSAARWRSLVPTKWCSQSFRELHRSLRLAGLSPAPCPRPISLHQLSPFFSMVTQSCP